MIKQGKNEQNGEGALREIVAGHFKFIERITRYKKPSQMNYLIEQASPLPIRHDKGEITIEALDGKSRVLWVSEGHISVPIVGTFLDKVIEYQISRAFKAMLDYIEGTSKKSILG